MICVLPTIFHQDERYYAMGEGGFWKRGTYPPLAFSSRASTTETIRSIFRRSRAAPSLRATSTTYYPSASTPVKSSRRNMVMLWTRRPYQRLSRVLAGHRHSRAAPSSVVRLSGLGRRIFLEMRRKLLDDEFLEEAGDAAFRDPDQRILKVQARAPITRRGVGKGDAAGDERSDDR